MPLPHSWPGFPRRNMRIAQAYRSTRLTSRSAPHKSASVETTCILGRTFTFILYVSLYLLLPQTSCPLFRDSLLLWSPSRIPHIPPDHQHCRLELSTGSYTKYSRNLRQLRPNNTCGSGPLLCMACPSSCTFLRQVFENFQKLGTQ